MTDIPWENLILQNFRIYLAGKLFGNISRHFSIANTQPVKDKRCENVVFLLSPALPLLLVHNFSVLIMPSYLILACILWIAPFIFNPTIWENLHVMGLIPQTLWTFVDDVLALEQFFQRDLMACLKFQMYE